MSAKGFWTYWQVEAFWVIADRWQLGYNMVVGSVSRIVVGSISLRFDETESNSRLPQVIAGFNSSHTNSHAIHPRTLRSNFQCTTDNLIVTGILHSPPPPPHRPHTPYLGVAVPAPEITGAKPDSVSAPKIARVLRGDIL